MNKYGSLPYIDASPEVYISEPASIPISPPLAHQSTTNDNIDSSSIAPSEAAARFTKSNLVSISGSAESFRERHFRLNLLVEGLALDVANQPDSDADMAVLVRDLQAKLLGCTRNSLPQKSTDHVVSLIRKHASQQDAPNAKLMDTLNNLNVMDTHETLNNHNVMDTHKTLNNHNVMDTHKTLNNHNVMDTHKTLNNHNVMDTHKTKDSSIHALEKRLANLENLVGIRSTQSYLNPAMLAGSDGTLTGAVQQIDYKLSLLTNTEEATAKYVRNLKVVAAEMAKIKESSLRIPESEKIDYIYTAIRKHEQVSSMLPNLILRLRALQTVHSETILFSSSLKQLHLDNAEIMSLGASLSQSHVALLQTVKLNQQTMIDNLKFIESRIQ